MLDLKTLEELQRGRALSRADRSWKRSTITPSGRFNGAARFHARIGCRAYRIRGRQCASTGPRAFTRGSLGPFPLPFRYGPGFNGAARFHARIGRSAGAMPHPAFRGFNGAARFHARIVAATGTGGFGRPCFNGAARFHARIVRSTDGVPRGCRASTGPRAFTRGSPGRDTNTTRLGKASTGPRAFTRGSERLDREAANHIVASTGPRAFTRGSVSSEKHFTCGMQLQRGRAPSRADRSAPVWERKRQTGFNGAARFHARIALIGSHLPQRTGRFNGAARFHARIAAFVFAG